MKRSLIFLSVVLLVTGCRNNETFTISGTISKKSSGSVYLNRVNINTPVFVDSSKISRKGKFHFRVREKNPDFYQIGYSPANFITILAAPGEKIKLEFNGENLYDDYTVSGSDGSEKVRLLDLRLSDAKKKLDSLRIVYEKASGEPGFEVKGKVIDNEYVNVIKELRKKNIEFIITNLKSMASIMALYQKIDENTYVLYNIHDLQYLKLVSDSLTLAYPDSPHVKALNEDFKNEMNRMNARRIQNLAEAKPEVKLDPNLRDINGKRISLSSLQGKTVLLTFWSATSKQCIAENLELKELYRNFKNKGFEIYQINLDTDEELWKKGVSFDALPWINVREDDPLNPENARLFNVRTLPANYLYDRKGEIIASDLHGKSLQIKLNQIFNN